MWLCWSRVATRRQETIDRRSDICRRSVQTTPPPAALRRRTTLDDVTGSSWRHHYRRSKSRSAPRSATQQLYAAHTAQPGGEASSRRNVIKLWVLLIQQLLIAKNIGCLCKQRLLQCSGNCSSDPFNGQSSHQGTVYQFLIFLSARLRHRRIKLRELIDYPHHRPPVGEAGDIVMSSSLRPSVSACVTTLPFTRLLAAEIRAVQAHLLIDWQNDWLVGWQITRFFIRFLHMYKRLEFQNFVCKEHVAWCWCPSIFYLKKILSKTRKIKNALNCTFVDGKVMKKSF